ncbi:MAG TPA: hypothetical protein VGD14_09605 [bacterium]
MKKLCDRCGSASPEMIGIGGALLCRTCDDDIRPEIAALRADNRPVNVLQIARRHFKENFAGGNYILREIPAGLETAWKQRALKDKCNQRDIVLAALTDYLK